ncbi:hypothetical protein QF002_006972 [Paraburkholderia youngii]
MNALGKAHKKKLLGVFGAALRRFYAYCMNP